MSVTTLYRVCVGVPAFEGVLACLSLDKVEKDARQRFHKEPLSASIKQSGRADRKRLDIDFQKNKSKTKFNSSTMCFIAQMQLLFGSLMWLIEGMQGSK